MPARRPNVPRVARPVDKSTGKPVRPTGSSVPAPTAQNTVAARPVQRATDGHGRSAAGHSRAAAEPAAAEPAEARPATGKPTAAKPAQARLTQAESTAETPTAARPAQAKSAETRLATGNPRVSRPSAQRNPSVATSAGRGPAHGSTARTGTARADASRAGAAHGGASRKSTSRKGPTGKSAARGDAASEGTARGGASRKPTPSEVRAAERSQLAGAIRRARAPFRRNAQPAIVPAEDAKPIPAKSFSGRLLALAVVLITITVLLAPSVRTYVQQQGELNALRADIAQQEQTQEDLQRQLDRWEDPAYIKQQARERILMVMPGERQYLVKGEDGLLPAGESAPETGPQDLPWVDALWGSVTRAATDQ